MINDLGQAVIPLGGLGTRVQSLTGGAPKCLMSFAGRPFLFYLLEWIWVQNVRRVHLLLGLGSEAILEKITSEFPYDLDITYSLEAQPLGVAGALRAAVGSLDSEFLLVYGDVIPRLSVKHLWNTHRKLGFTATLTLSPSSTPSTPGNCLLHENGRIEYFPEKLSHGDSASLWLDAGASILKLRALQVVPASGMYLEKDLFKSLSARGELGGHLNATPSHDIGNLEGAELFRTEVANLQRGERPS